MAEVKTYKCDICGQVYHVDDSSEDCSMSIADQTVTEDRVHTNEYEHICPECADKIRKVIEDPEIFKKTNERYAEQLKEKYHYKELLDRIFDAISLEFCTRLYGSSKRKTDEAIEKVEDLKKSRDIWKRVAAATIGLLIGFGIGALLKLLGV